jgi:hopene-associated glycosyltransferase HpnB
MAFMCVAALSLWVIILILPWRPWSTRETLEADAVPQQGDLRDTTVLIPARNEAACIEKTLGALNQQGSGLNVILIDDGSTDATADIARGMGMSSLEILTGQPLPHGWSGKLWALEQGRTHIRTPLVLLLDADIELAPGMLHGLRGAMREKQAPFISLMAMPSLAGFWERLMMPAYVYFFKLLYPFALSNSVFPKVAAAAGGCILMEARLLEEMGGFHAVKDALIDDCALAGRVKSMGVRTWIGLTHSVVSHRRSTGLADIANMVARTAFTQLRYSTIMLLLCTSLLITAFWLPLAGLFLPLTEAWSMALATCAIMIITYIPTLRFYGLPVSWATLLPFAATLFLAMTWLSAIRYWRGERSRWKGRRYQTA